RISVNRPLTVFLLALIGPYSSEVQQPIRATVVLGQASTYAPGCTVRLRAGLRLCFASGRPGPGRRSGPTGGRPALGVRLGATRMNNLRMIRTRLDNRERQARGHELI